MSLYYVLEKERCSILGLPNKPTLTAKVFNSSFRADTKVLNAGFNALQKIKKTISSMLGLHDKPTLTPKFFNPGFNALPKKKKTKKKRANTDIGYNHTIYWCSNGFAGQTNTDTTVSMLASMLYYQTQTNNDISSPFSILGSIPHHYTYMKRHVSNVVFNTDTKSLQCWFSSLLKQVFTAKVCVRNHHTPKTNLCIYICSLAPPFCN